MLTYRNKTSYCVIKTDKTVLSIQLMSVEYMLYFLIAGLCEILQNDKSLLMIGMNRYLLMCENGNENSRYIIRYTGVARRGFRKVTHNSTGQR